MAWIEYDLWKAMTGSGDIWVPNFNGTNSYMTLLTTFTPSGAGTILTIKGVYKSKAAAQQLIAPSTSTCSITTDASNVLSFALLTGVTVNGVAATSGTTVLSSGYFELVGTLDSTADIKTIGANASFANNFQSQIHEVALADPYDGVVNGRNVVVQNWVNSYGEVAAKGYSNSKVTFNAVFLDVSTTKIIYDEGFDLFNGCRVYVAGGHLYWSRVDSFYVDGVLTTANGTFALTSGRVYTIEFYSSYLQTAPLIVIGAQYITSRASFKGFISNLRLTDLDNPSNSRFYPMDTLELVDSLGDGSTDGTWYNSPTLTYRENNSLDIDMAISSETMPTETSVYNKLTGATVGNLINLGTTQPYVLKETE